MSKESSPPPGGPEMPAQKRPPSPQAARARRQGWLARLLPARSSLPEWLGPLAALVLIVVGVSIFRPRFLVPANIVNVVQNWSFAGIIAVGMTFVIVQGGIDLSVGSLLAMVSVLGVWIANTIVGADALLAEGAAHHGAIRLALAGAADTLGLAGNHGAAGLIGGSAVLLTGLAAGVLNGLVIAKGRIAPFIATLGGLAAYRSIARTLAQGGAMELASEQGLLTHLGTGGIPLPVQTQYGQAMVLGWPIVVFLLVAAGGWLLLNRTRYGRYVYATGSNELAARYSAVPVDRVRLMTYALIGALTGLAAMLYTGYMNTITSTTTGVMWELDVIAAVVIGGTRLSGGVGSIGGTVIGLLIIGVIGNMLNVLQVSSHLHGLVKGLIIVAAVLLHRARPRR